MDQERQAIEEKLKLAQNYIDMATALINDVHAHATRVGAKAAEAGWNPQMGLATVAEVSAEPQSALARASYGVGRMLGWLTLFFAGMIAGVSAAESKKPNFKAL